MLSLKKRILKIQKDRNFFLVMTLLLCSPLAVYGNSKKIYRADRRMGDRFYIASRLQRIFGAESSKTLEENILSKVRAFGGACSPYNVISEFQKEGKKRINHHTKYRCYSGLADSKVEPFIDAGILRTGHLHKTCDLLVAKQQTYQFAINLAGLGSNSAKSDSNLKKMLRLFYPHSKKLPLALKKVKNPSWKLILSSLCKSDYWQIP
ncbi:MAG: hypothetical protein HN509_02720 [Halobacteriovoraceae bacterium]|jgi:hypothetical protein|nr:hypothetical protein [Halobacteriovoraceae bacterium]MBT5095433.1 hypothetical protein [Halobacteriovoraceae bacterium]